MDASLNIVDLIERNPITKLSQDYNVKLLTKIKSNFTDFEQQLFLSSFYCYLNHHPTNDFVIDLDGVWKWLGFSQKVNAKSLLEKHFSIDKDYIKPLLVQQKHSSPHRGGHNKETFLMNIKTFKSLCLKAGTKKADEIHDYYMKMEEMIQEIVTEECNELKLRLEQKDQIIEVQQNQIETQHVQSEKEKEELKERTLVEQFPENTQCIYIGKIDNKTKSAAEILIKFGQSNNLAERVKTHKKTYDNFRLYAAYKVKNKIEIENLMKKHPILRKRLRPITTQDGTSHREILAIDTDEFSIANIEEHIKEIIKQNEYNLENYNLLLKKVSEQENEIFELKRELEAEKKQTTELTLKLQNYTGECDTSTKTMYKIASNYAICKYGYLLYAFQYDDMRFICSITRQKDFEPLSKTLTDQYPKGEMKINRTVSYPFSEKNMMFLLKQHCVNLGANKFEASFENIQKIINIAATMETVMTENAKDLDKLLDIVNGTVIRATPDSQTSEPIPMVRKAKRSVDQIHKDTGELISVHESIEAAGRAIGLTTGTAIGLALREKRVCQGFLWRYSGFTKGEQFDDKPIIKVCCSTGERTHFATIADAARDANVTAPALRQRVLTDVHANGNHWIF